MSCLKAAGVLGVEQALTVASGQLSWFCDSALAHVAFCDEQGDGANVKLSCLCHFNGGAVTASLQGPACDTPGMTDKC